MERWRDARGQAASEYVALVALVAVVLALAAGLTSGGVGGQVLAGLQRGLCHVAIADCPRPEPPRADLAPCTVSRGGQVEELAVTIAVVRLGTSGTLSVVRMSDGRVAVALAHGSEVGAEVGLGARLRLGRRALGGQVTGGSSVRWTSGRSWTFADEAAARRFVDAFGRKVTIGGKLLDDVRSVCSGLCDAIGWRPHAQLPQPDEIYGEVGSTAGMSASFGAGGEVGVDAGALLGRRLRSDGTRTWYLRLDAAATAALALPVELVPGVGGEAVLAYEVGPDDRPRALRLQLSGELRGRAAARRASGVAHATLAAGGALVVDLDAELDLREPGNRAAAIGLLRALTSARALPALPERARAFGQRIRRHAQLDRRTYAAIRATTGLGAGVARGTRFDGGFERTTSGSRLLHAETRLPGLPFLPRDDCRTA